MIPGLYESHCTSEKNQTAVATGGAQRTSDTCCFASEESKKADSFDEVIQIRIAEAIAEFHSNLRTPCRCSSHSLARG